ncbi:rRNA-processing protein FCF1 -like protein [Collichthys lucidus]|uniref:rRNA-processing protein FCF1-like protein n=1 Tax=Collichthys lucidus TaxID=240159 RepID=A0A4V6AS17_COLLU|nr:rRNA-processing protein FCF1 -like protein [Collichthys lucidus]
MLTDVNPHSYVAFKRHTDTNTFTGRGLQNSTQDTKGEATCVRFPSMFAVKTVAGETENKAVCCDEENDQSERYQTSRGGITEVCASLLTICLFCRKEKDRAKAKEKRKKDPSKLKEREVLKHPSCLFFQYNTQLGPPYNILVDTNFINFSIKAKLDIVQSMMDCLYAKCIPHITDCVMAEIEKLGMKYRVALRYNIERMPDDYGAPRF